MWQRILSASYSAPYSQRSLSLFSLNHDLLTVYDINTLLGLGLAGSIQVVNSDVILGGILNRIDSNYIVAFLYKHEVLPSIRCLVLIDSTLWYIKCCIIECVK